MKNTNTTIEKRPTNHTTPLVGHTVTLYEDDKRVKIIGWLDKDNVKELKEYYSSMFTAFTERYTDIDLDINNNILVAVEQDGKTGILVHISDIVGYVKTDLPR